VGFAVAPDGQDLWLFDSATGERLLSSSEVEAERQAAVERAIAAEAELARLRRQLGLDRP
jgi:hypothetical protein